jgi:homoserine kinase type II
MCRDAPATARCKWRGRGNGLVLDAELLARVCRLWRVRLAHLRPELAPSGSPERSLGRAVIEDETGRLLLAERLAPAMAPRKMRIAATLAALASGGLEQAPPYLADGSGRSVLPMGDGYWQVSPYLPGDPVPRPGWVDEAWRGRALARFLSALQRVATLARLPPQERFSPGAFVADLQERLIRNRPHLAAEMAPIVRTLLTDWLPPEGALPLAFCHGDPHPLNVIWQGQAIRAVVDWEFCGTKPAAYDAALIIGCAGSEEPGALTGPLVRALLAGLRAASAPYDPASLWSLVLGTRFGWLSDWLRRRDEEMVALEAAYIHLLVAQRAELMADWARA